MVESLFSIVLFAFSTIVSAFAYARHRELGDGVWKAGLKATFWFPLVVCHLGWEALLVVRPFGRTMANITRMPHTRPTPRTETRTTSNRRPVCRSSTLIPR